MGPPPGNQSAQPPAVTRVQGRATALERTPRRAAVCRMAVPEWASPPAAAAARGEAMTRAPWMPLSQAAAARAAAARAGARAPAAAVRAEAAAVRAEAAVPPAAAAV